MDPFTGGMLVFFVCFCAALILGVGFAVAICRGTREERHERAA